MTVEKRLENALSISENIKDGKICPNNLYDLQLHLSDALEQVKKLTIPAVRGSLPSSDDATKVAVRISEEAIKPPLDAKEQAVFIAGFQECIKWLNVVFSNDR